MGQANLRGSFSERKAYAIDAGFVKKGMFEKEVDKHRHGMTYFFGGHRNSGRYSIRPHRLNRPWKRRAAGL